MCGFIGRIKVEPREPSGDLRDGLQYLKRRGPDSSMCWSSSDGRIELGHARLAIVDADVRAHQPLEDRERGLCVVFNGEIYNYRELRSALKGYAFRTTSDTEIILALYSLEGIKGLRMLRGMYSIALADTLHGRVFLVRDAVGKKPLYLARWGREVWFGSSVLALVAACGQASEINEEVRGYFWQHGFVPPRLSAICGVRPVLPGEIIEMDERGVELRRDRHTPASNLLYAGESVREVIQRVRELLEEAVERRLHNNPDPAVLLSGGIDSTVVTSVADRLQRRGVFTSPLRVLTLGSMVPLRNDELYARYAAHRMKRSLQVVRPSFRHLEERVLHSFDLQDEPLGVISFFPLERLVSEVASVSRVLLSGDGGDEVFLGYGKPSDWTLSSSGRREELSAIECGPSMPGWMSDWGRCMVSDHLVGHNFSKVDRASAEQGVEMRSPLLDWDVMSYARSLPFEILTHGGRTKSLLKAQLGGWPNWFLERRKLGFAINLRWLWSVSNFAGLRESISEDALAMFEQWLPRELRRPTRDWKVLDILRRFEPAWRLLAWSRFLSKQRSLRGDRIRS